MEKRRTYSVIGKNIIKKISNKTILDDVNITVEKQSIYAVLGENRSGKSVLLRCLMGILEQDGGDVIITDDTSSTLASGSGSGAGGGHEGQAVTRRPKVGFAPQKFNMPGPMRIHHLLYFVGAVHGLVGDQIVKRYETIAQMIGLPVTADFPVDRLRYSQKKVLSLVLAIVHDPEVLILDDITTGLDTVTLKNIWTLLTYINISRECTIIVSASNNFCFMETAVTHIGILMNGKIVREGTTTNLMAQFKTSSIDDLFVEIIFTEDHQQRDPQIGVPEKRESAYIVLQALILKNIWTLIGINFISFTAFMCVILFCFSAHASFSTNRQKELKLPIKVQNDDYGDYKNRTIEPLSNVFISHHLASAFEVIYATSKEFNNYYASKHNIVNQFECLLYFDKNYTVALRRRIERIIKNNVDFENSQIIIRMNITDGRDAVVVKNRLFEVYKQFLSNYSHNMLTEYVTDINGDSIKYNMVTYDDDRDYPIYGRFVNSGLIVILAFFVHGAIAVRLQQVTGKDCYYNEWMSYLARLAVQIPIAVVLNALLVLHMHVLYDIISSHLCYVYLCLLLESVCGIHIGNQLAIIRRVKQLKCAYRFLSQKYNKVDDWIIKHVLEPSV